LQFNIVLSQQVAEQTFAPGSGQISEMPFITFNPGAIHICRCVVWRRRPTSQTQNLQVSEKDWGLEGH